MIRRSTRQLAAACGLVALVLATPAAAQEEPFTFVALGDMPYYLPEDYQRFERLIDAINAAAPVFSIHVGDTKSGGSECSDAMLQATLDRFMLFQQPLVYTPGDNEWTDCHRASAGGYDPRERLARVREMHFSQAMSLGANPMPVTRQADVSDYTDMVENLRWTHNGVLFATVHIVGSNNGFETEPEAAAEYFARNAANIAWIADAFALAEREGDGAVVFAFQADPDYYGEHWGDSGFTDSLRAFTEGATDFGKPVLLVQGDAHVMIIDQPLRDENGQVLENVTRLQVMGAQEVHAVAVTVYPGDASTFSFRPLIVPENRLQQ
ncbi:MAG: metallophosphoesterase [Rhodospirillaceae bacterium]|nr:metallophosphoesterase [Rhodospirillaceae bacterium]